MNGKHFSHLENIGAALENSNTDNGYFNPSEIPNLIESHSSKSVTITFIDPGGTVSHIVSEAKFGKESSDPQTTYLVIPTSAARDARYGGDSVAGCEDLNVDAIQGVQVDFADEASFDSPEGNLPPTDNESENCEPRSIEVAGDIFSDAFESKGLHTIECFNNEEDLTKDCLKSTLNFRRTNHDCPDIEISIDPTHNEKFTKFIDVGVALICLVCAKTISKQVEAMVMSSCTMPNTRRSATTVLAKTLGDPVSLFTSPGCALCQACFNLLQMVDTLEYQLQQATSQLRMRYRHKKQESSSKQSNQLPKTAPRTGEQEASCYGAQTSGDDGPVKKGNGKLLESLQQKPTSSPFNLVSNPMLRRDEYRNVLKDLSRTKSTYSAEVSAHQDGHEALATVNLAVSDPLDDEYEAETVIKIEEADNTEGEVMTAAAAELEAGGGEGTGGLDRRKRGRPKKIKKNIKCHYCGKLFRAKYYRVHLNSHTREEQFPCSACELIFYSKSSLLSHVRRNHDGPGVKKHRCPECAKGFIYRREMERHVNTVHNNVRQHSCLVCQRTFKHVQHLNYHMRSHTGEKPNSCPVCSRRFRRPGELKNHVIKVHEMQYSGKYRERLTTKAAQGTQEEEWEKDEKLLEGDGGGVSVARVVTVGTSDPDLFRKAEG